MISIPIWLFVILIILATPIALVVIAYTFFLIVNIIQVLENLVIALNGDREEIE